MLKPESVVRFYVYTTKLHMDELAKRLVDFDDVHLEPPEDLPGLKPQTDLETPHLDAYEEIVRTLERSSALTGIPLEEFVDGVEPKDALSVDIKTLEKEMDDLVGKYLSLKKELELAKKAKSLLKEKEKRLEKLEQELAQLELKIREYYAAALEVTEEDPSKIRLGRIILEIDRKLLRISSLLRASTDPSLSLDDVNEILKNTYDLLISSIEQARSLHDEIENLDLLKIIERLENSKTSVEEILSKLRLYTEKREKLSELKAVESLWERVRDKAKKVPELSPLIAEREPSIAKVVQAIASLEDEMKNLELEIRNDLSSLYSAFSDLRDRFKGFRDSTLSIKTIAAGEAEQRVIELIDQAKPLISERGKVEEEVSKLRRLLEETEKEALKKDLELTKERIVETGRLLASVAMGLRSQALLEKIKSMMYVGEEIAAISGWVPARKRSEFEHNISEGMGEFAALEFESRIEKAPSKVRLPSIFKPLRLLTHKLYGFPTVTEVDPTSITAILFPLMFGMMYGDIGHGLTLAIFGAILLSRSSGSMRELAGILIYSGVAAAFFGYLYGKIFFVAFTEHPILSPIHDTYSLMALALLFGAFQLTLGFALNTINKILEGDWFAALFEFKGLATLVMYAGAVVAAVRNNGVVMDILRDPLFQMMAVPLLITVVAPVMRSIKEGHGVGEGASEAIATLLESVLALLSNSLSYIRLAAFAIIHEVFGVLASQMVAGKHTVTLADLHVLMSLTALIPFAFVNIAVMGLEGLLSFIQATRLTFYEFFTKFYKAIGREFKRVSELLVIGG